VSESFKEEKINQLISELEEIVVKENARLQVYSECDGDVGGIVGNQQGYLCFGIEMLKAAYTETKSDKNAEDGNLSIDTSYLFDPCSAFIFKWFGRREDLEPILTVTPRSAKFIMGGVLFLLIAGVAFAAVGLITVIKWVI
jgi:hypothetical protein